MKRAGRRALGLDTDPRALLGSPPPHRSAAPRQVSPEEDGPGLRPSRSAAPSLLASGQLPPPALSPAPPFPLTPVRHENGPAASAASAPEPAGPAPAPALPAGPLLTEAARLASGPWGPGPVHARVLTLSIGPRSAGSTLLGGQSPEPVPRPTLHCPCSSWACCWTAASGPRGPLPAPATSTLRALGAGSQLPARPPVLVELLVFVHWGLLGLSRQLQLRKTGFWGRLHVCRISLNLLLAFGWAPSGDDRCPGVLD